ncbi:GNAT family N-acetyltransferase [Halolamina salifodinae]|uniref:RimJ/RimL family protein N-acetyltransferase n=1 Tax=Halolamina salifodinae TaxID=1202767 RepID=A0A8T4GZ35_9EURY|nr:GNAT family protein [Halolamina salifodinae]MBP1988241.1 RimJ/RimL family protein N-acetyltransferase [Halolamina salifodinae]
MSDTTFIHGDRIELRPLEEGDIPHLVEAENHPEIRRHISSFRTPLSESTYREERWPPSDNGVTLAIVPKDEADSDKAIGSASVGNIQQPDGYGNFSIWLHPDAWGNGYALEAGAFLLDHAFRSHRLHRISATVAASNGASRRLCERLGFVEEGAARESWYLDDKHVDAVHYGLLEREWEGPASVLD